MKDIISIRVRVMTVQMGNRFEIIPLFLQSFNPFWAGDRAVLLSKRNFQIGVRLARGDPSHTPKSSSIQYQSHRNFKSNLLSVFK